MKSEKGITITSLVIYVILLILVISILATVSSYFYSNVNRLTDMGKYVAEFNKFNMYFIEDVKNNTDILAVENNRIMFEDGTIYTFQDESVYRNKVKICEDIYSMQFNENEEEDDNNFTKRIVIVNMAIKGSELFETSNEYVLKYW